tara:strand:- start:73 stop:1590 length:1518 start_codon:yes stop_codon:yes gene_type:complete
MAQTILIKRSTSTSTPSALANGELAYSAQSNKLYIGRPGGGTGDIDAIGGKYYTDIITAATASNTASKLVLRDSSGNFSAGTITGTFSGNLTGNVTGNVSGTALSVTQAAQTAITSVGTLTALQVDNLNLNGNTFSSTTGAVNITPAAGSAIVLDGTINIDAGVLTGATSISSTAFVGTLSTVSQPNITSVGTLTALQVDNINLNGNVLSSTTGNLSITPVSGSTIVLDGTVIVDAGVITGATSITSTTFVGALTGNSSTATTLQTARNFSASGDLTAPNVSFNGGAAVDLVTTLATVNSNVGSFGGTTAIPSFTVNAKGLITAASEVVISSTLDIAADSGTDNGVLIGTDTLTVSGGTGVTTSVAGDTITIDIGQAVATTSNVTFNNVTVNGTLASDDITAATMTASGHVVVQGNLTVNGTTTTVNSNTVAIGDSIMTLNTDETGTPSENAGFEIERGTSTNVSLLWNEGTDYWQISDGSTTSKIMTAGNFAASFTGILDGGTF